jgi:molybdate transport system substrate-binding protein
LVAALLLSLALLGAACSSSSTTDTSATTTAAGVTPATAGGSTPGSVPGSIPGTTIGSVPPGTIIVSAAASLTTPFKTIGDQFKAAHPGTDVKFNFDSSGTLATQIQAGAPADVFASADQANMKKLTDGSLISGTPQVFARNKLTIVVKPGNPKHVQSLADLATVGTVSLCATTAPCGTYADQMLKSAGVTIPADKITRGQNVKTTLSAVSDGDADAGIVYVTDAKGAKVDTVTIPDSQNVIATYPIGVVAATKEQANAEAFDEYVLSAPAQKVLQDAGFLPPT